MKAQTSVLSRRQFLGTAAAAAAVVAGTHATPRPAPAQEEKPFRGGKFKPPIVIATWAHGAKPVDLAFQILEENGSPLDAVERGINLSELEPRVQSVGYGGLPNEEGVVELDAAIMDGQNLRCGSVLGLKGFRKPISVARRVMEKTRHIQLASEGARAFALAQGFQEMELLTEDARKKWEEWKASPERKVPGEVDDKTHDTIGMVALSRDGKMAAGCSTSGLAWKMPGRVGDSPIVGAGLYCDGEVGGASATGIGEEIIRVCGGFLIVESMRRGSSPQEAVEEALKRIVKIDPENRQRQVAFIAMSRQGEVGSGSIRGGFQLSIRSGGQPMRTIDTWSLVS